MFNVLSVNARGLRDTVKRTSLFFSLKALDFQVCFLQECHLKNTEDIKRFSKDWKAGASVWSIGNVHSDGVGIIFKDTGFVIEEERIIIPGRLVYVDGRLNNNKLRLVNVYAPALKGERLDFFKHLPNVLCTNRIVIMGGDFNTYLEGEYDFTAQYLKNVLGDYNLADIYRRHNKKGIGHTWRNSRGASKRLDYLFISKTIQSSSFFIYPNWFSDHDIIGASCQVQGVEIGRGFWKLNMKELECAEFRAEFTTFYNSWRDMKWAFKNTAEWWEAVKIKIRYFCQIYSKRKKKEERHLEKELQDELQAIHSEINEGKQVCGEEYRNIQKKIEHNIETKVKNFAFLAKITEKEQDEKCSKFFFQSIKEKQRRCAISELETGRGKVTKKEDIMTHAQEFYQALFKKREVDNARAEELLNNISKKLNNEERTNLEREVSKKEIEEALKSLKADKTPGCDGLPK